MKKHSFKTIGKAAVMLLCLISLLGTPAAAFAEGGAPEVTGIASAEDLRKIAEDPSGAYYLADDIDMSGEDWEPLAFSGVLDGQGHTIYNLKVTRTGSARADTLDGNAKVYDSVFAGLFSTLTGAEVKDLSLCSVDIDVTSSEHCFAGAVAGYVKDSVVSGCRVSDARVRLVPSIKPDPANPRKSCNAGVGGFAGFGSGTFSGCWVDAVLIFEDQCDRALKVEEFLGGAVSCGNPVLTDCHIVINGYDECRGYAHNGGLVGMYYQYDKEEPVGSITGCTVEGQITFFEDNRDRRAYCKPYIGEFMTWPAMSGNSERFKTNEIFDYSAKLSPEKCQAPSVSTVVTEGDCENWGYSTHSCSVCGNTWRDSYTPPVHVPSNEWKIVSEPAGGVDGLRQMDCSRCGRVIEEETLPAVQKIQLDQTELKISYKDEAYLRAVLTPEDATYQKRVWSSSDESVATVDQGGVIKATGRGTAVISCSTEDGFAKGECKVTVGYSFKQWIIKTVLFGWIWY